MFSSILYKSGCGIPHVAGNVTKIPRHWLMISLFQMNRNLFDLIIIILAYVFVFRLYTTMATSRYIYIYMVTLELTRYLITECIFGTSVLPVFSADHHIDCLNFNAYPKYSNGIKHSEYFPKKCSRASHSFCFYI